MTIFTESSSSSSSSFSSSSSSSSSYTPPVPKKRKISPIVVPLRRPRPIRKCRRTSNFGKKKSDSSGSVKEISKGSFEKAFKKPSSNEILEETKTLKWVKTRFLGRGSFGAVHLATSKTNGYKKIAMKSAEYRCAESLKLEKSILSRLKSPYIVGCYGDEIRREKNRNGEERIHYNVLLEYCAGESLGDLIIKQDEGLPENDVKVFAKDILRGLVYIHNENIIHCDVKPDNILLVPVTNLVRSNGYLAKLADFESAMEKGSVEYGDGSGHLRGTMRYVSPEVITKESIDCSSDIWSFGCTVLEMLTGEATWSEYCPNMDSGDWLYMIGESDLIPKIPEKLSEEAKDFLRKCFVKKATGRMTASELLNHSFLNSQR